MARRIPERDLILPSLYLMSLHGGNIATAELSAGLRYIMKPDGEDLEILAERTDDKFSQKVRNLKSHNTFEKSGLAKYDRNTFHITVQGKKHLADNEDILKYLLANDFAYYDLTDNLRKIEANANTRRIQIFDENIIIQEGIKSIIDKGVYDRSITLRRYALDHYSRNGTIDCSCCGFNYADFYGEEIGSSFIEMHHVRPIFRYADEDIVKTIKAAVTNIAPVCSNCHRMIHRSWAKPLELAALIRAVNANGVFARFS